MIGSDLKMAGTKGVVVLDPTRRWECPSCGQQTATRKPLTTFPLHPCPKQAGLTVPFVEVEGSELPRHSVTHRVVERGDWIGREVGVRRDESGRAVMAVQTERSDGSYDTHVFAPLARMERE